MAVYDPRGFAVEHFVDGHDGDGWYYWDSEYPEEGSVGAFESLEAAVKHAAESYTEELED